jgi:hypothetical protein
MSNVGGIDISIMSKESYKKHQSAQRPRSEFNFYKLRHETLGNDISTFEMNLTSDKKCY